MNNMSPGSGRSDERKKATGFIAHNFKVVCAQLLNVFEMRERKWMNTLGDVGKDGGGRMN